MKFSRQCVWENQEVELASGIRKRAKNISVGDVLISFNKNTHKVVNGRVSNVWDNGEKRVFLITTKSGCSVTVTGNHPLWTQRGWVMAADLEHTDFLAKIKTTPEFSFAENFGTDWAAQVMKISMEQDSSGILHLSKESARLFLKAYFAQNHKTVTYAKKRYKTLYIDAHTYNIAKDIQFLLLKFGIPTTRPRVHGKVYIGFSDQIFKEKLLRLIDADESLIASTVSEDKKGTGVVIPTEVLKDIPLRVLDTFIKDNPRTVSRATAKAAYEEFPTLSVEKVLNSDYTFEEINSIKELSEKPTIAIEIEGTHTFTIDSIITHNTAKSTTLSNILLARALLIPNFKQLYVSPAVAQTQEFARDKLEPVINNSPLVRENFVTPNMVQNVYKKEFTNGSVINLRYALLNADRIRGVSADVNLFDECYTPDMEVLTIDGWKKFPQLTLNDQLATINKDHQLEYQSPERLIEKDYKGYIHVYKHRSSILKVTPRHNLLISQELSTGYYKNPKVKGWNLVESQNAENKNFKMSCAPSAVHGEYKGEPYFTISAGEYDFALSTRGKRVDGAIKSFNSESYPIEPFYRFIGWYLSEGHTGANAHYIFITQNEGPHAKIIRDDLQSLGVEWTEVKEPNSETIQFRVYSKALWHYLSPLGKSHEKYIPRELMTQERAFLLNSLLSRLYMGDAIKRPGTSNPMGELKTASKKLADTVQYSWFLLGHRASIRESSKGLRRGYKYMHYLVRKLKLPYQIFWNSSNRVIKENYIGKVYCATVPNSTLVIRHEQEKGIFISGNCQDLQKDVIGVVEETMSRSLVKKSIYAGTPKRSKGTLADFWFGSTQNEYAVKSSASGHWNILGPDNIGANGLIDKKSGLPLDLRKDKGEWVSTYSTAGNRPYIEGFRVCLLHFAHSPWVDWQSDVMYKMENTSTALFYNETLGLEYDSGAIPITEEELMRACNDLRKLSDDVPSDCIGRPSIMGIDYGPVNSENSRTVITILQQRGSKIVVVYAKKFLGKEADYAFIHEEIPKLFAKWGCIALASDYGMGEASNSEFRQRLGPEKVMPFQHLATQKEPIHFNPKMRAYTLNKNYVMNLFFKMIKTGKIEFPNYPEMKFYLDDLRNVVIEYDEEKNSERYTNIGADDWTHSTLYAILLALFLFEGVQENLN